jgi:hypothetical protein
MGYLKLTVIWENFTNNLIHFIFQSYRTIVTTICTKSYTLFCEHLEIFLKYF